MEVLAWRDRRLRELPAGAQITALKLTDAVSKAVLFEKILATTPGATTTDAALQPLLDQLRTLRAKAFVTDRFTPTVTVDGAEHPWKYQLDVTVALVGGTGTQSSTYTLLFSERIGGGRQIAGAQDLDAVFEIEQPLLDALWKLTYGPQDPGPAAEPTTATTTPASQSSPSPAPAAQPPPTVQPTLPAAPATAEGKARG